MACEAAQDEANILEYELLTCMLEMRVLDGVEMRVEHRQKALTGTPGVVTLMRAILMGKSGLVW